ncbi:MAG: pyrroline-5-carboxylate reductase [Erysipelotrichaceae bacterium]|nr:pyrroline-5-carboxylate reductase [Erysipelotrichaceae bacterium]MDD3810054.1 pyrroline-5-carboxylate reductase [Erysipelotrichaceae bacterium]
MMAPKIGFVGLGNMASALFEGLIQAGAIDPANTIGYDIAQSQVDYFHDKYAMVPASSELDVATWADIVIMGVKPDKLETVIGKIREAAKNKTIVSMVLGYNFERFHALVDPSTAHVTMMPNTPVKVSQGVILFEQENNLKAEELEAVVEMFSKVATVKVLPASIFKGASVLTGCGPAYVYQIIEALSDGVVELGVPRDLAYELVSQTVLGSAMMQKETKLHPGILKDQVCSPGGITIKGVNALEKNGLRHALIEGVKASSGK